MRYNYLDLFHGIGGFAYGAYLAGMKFDNHLCSDVEPYCQKLYKLRFPDSIQLGDITKIDTMGLIKKYGTEWIITGGFPCQDISIAGKGAGITGSRSGLWFEYWRLIRGLRPEIAIMENVGAITFRGLTTVLGSLAEIGYNAEWQDIRASDVGAPHKRERIWIVAYPVQYGCRNTFFTEEGAIDNNKKSDSENEKSRWKPEQSRIIETCSNVAYPDGERYLFGQNEVKSAKNGKYAQCDISAESKMADTKETECEWIGDSWSRRNGSTNSSKKISNTTITGLEREKSEGVRRGKQRLFTECNRWPIEPAVCGIFNELSERLDRLKK